jgi:RND family efflux transporter MFP subunit
MCLFKNSKKILALMIAGGTILSGCGILPKEEQTLAPPLVKPEKQQYETYEVNKKDITRAVKGNGTLISMSENDVFTKENGRRVKSVKVQFGQTVKKGEVLIELDAENMENNIQIQQYSLKRAQINYERAEQGSDVYAKQLAEIDVKVEKTKLENMQKQLNASRLSAPADGKVIFLETLREGDMIEAYKTLVTVADTKKLQVLYQSTNLPKIQTGLQTVLSLGGNKYEGIVAQIPTTGKYKDSIIINFENMPTDVSLGDAIEVAVTLETKKDTLVVPKNAVKNFMGNNVVEVLDGDKKASLDVEKGIENSTEVEILSGLKEGQKVILK